MQRQFIGIKRNDVIVPNGVYLHESKKPKFEQMEHDTKMKLFRSFPQLYFLFSAWQIFMCHDWWVGVGFI